MQRAIAYDAYFTRGLRLSDGSTSLHQNIFLAKKHMKLNPKQEAYECENIAILGVDHIGMIMKSSMEIEKHKEVLFQESAS